VTSGAATVDYPFGGFAAERLHDAVAQYRTRLSGIAEIGGEGVLTVNAGDVWV
jgi:hypothetical protein